MLSEGVDAERAGPSTSIGVADMAGSSQILQAPGFGRYGLDGGQTREVCSYLSRVAVRVEVAGSSELRAVTFSLP